MDFAQHGSSTSFRIITSSVPFLNAQLQGIHRTFRALGAKTLVGGKLTAEEKIEAARAWHMTMNLSIVGGVLLPMAHYKSEDEDIRRIYAEIPTYIKDANFVWVMPKFLSETNQLFLIPKPFDFGIIPTVVEKFLDEEYLEYDSNVIREYLWKAFTTMTRADASILPQYIRPFFEIAINEKFTKSPIVPEHLRGTGLAERRYYTSATAIALAELFDNVHILPETFKSPLKVEHLLTSFFGTLGGFTMDYVTDPAFRSFLKMADVPTKAPGSRWPWEEGAKKPGKFGKILPIQIASSTFDNTRSQNEWYKVWTKINNAKSKIDTYDDMADTHSVENWNKHRDDPDNREYWLNHPWAASAMDQLAAINNQIEYVARYDPDNYERRDQLMQQRAEITRTYNDVFLTSQSAIRNTERRRALSMQRSVIGQAHGGLVTGDPVKAFRDSMNMADGGAVWDKVKEGAGKAWDFMTEGAEDAPPPKEPSPIREIGGEVISAINHPLKYAWEATEGMRDDIGDKFSKQRQEEVDLQQLRKEVLPTNVRAFLDNTFSGRFGPGVKAEDLTPEELSALYEAVQNKVNRTGAMSGTFTYDDYGPRQDIDQRLNGSLAGTNTLGLIEGAVKRRDDPVYNMQTTIGGGTYSVDPDTGKITIGDNYNFDEATDGKVLAWLTRNAQPFSFEVPSQKGNQITQPDAFPVIPDSADPNAAAAFSMKKTEDGLWVAVPQNWSINGVVSTNTQDGYKADLFLPWYLQQNGLELKNFTTPKEAFNAAQTGDWVMLDPAAQDNMADGGLVQRKPTKKPPVPGEFLVNESDAPSYGDEEILDMIEGFKKYNDLEGYPTGFLNRVLGGAKRSELKEWPVSPLFKTSEMIPEGAILIYQSELDEAIRRGDIVEPGPLPDTTSPEALYKDHRKFERYNVARRNRERLPAYAELEQLIEHVANTLTLLTDESYDISDDERNALNKDYSIKMARARLLAREAWSNNADVTEEDIELNLRNHMFRTMRIGERI